MRRRDFLAAALPLAGCAATPPAARYRVIDLMPAYWAFRDAAQGLALEEQARLFVERVARPHPQVYAASVLAFDAAQPPEPQLERRWLRVQQMVGPREPLMRRISASIAADLPRYEASFRRTFPDLAYDGEIWFMHSVGGFDGATRTVRGRMALLFGIDMIAWVYGEDADPQPFFHHELFHVYHSQFAPAPGGPSPVYHALWREGLATWVAHALNPSAAGVGLFGVPRETPQQAQARLPELARRLRDELDSTAKEDYARWFFGNSGPNAPVPPRSGYYLGYLVAGRLARGRSLRELAHLPAASLRPAIGAALDELGRAS